MFVGDDYAQSSLRDKNLFLIGIFVYKYRHFAIISRCHIAKVDIYKPVISHKQNENNPRVTPGRKGI